MVGLRIGILGIALLAAPLPGCGLGSDDGEVAALRQRVAKLEKRIEKLEKGRSGNKAAQKAARATGGRGKGSPAKGAGRVEAIRPDRVEQVVSGAAPEVQGQLKALVSRWQERDAQGLSELARTAGLDAEKKAKLEQMLAGERASLLEVYARGKGSLDFEGGREKAQAIREGYTQKIALNLEPEQQEAWRAFRSKSGDE